MTLTIENANDDLVKAIKSMAKIANAKVKVSKDKASKSREKYLQELTKEADETLKLYKEGKIKAYKTAEEMFKDIENEV